MKTSARPRRVVEEWSVTQQVFVSRLIIGLLLTSCYVSGEGVTTLAPERIVALVGTRVQFNCTTTNVNYSVEWRRRPPGEQRFEPVTFRGALVDEYKSAYETEWANETGSSNNLIIREVRLSDSGVFQCRLDEIDLSEESQKESNLTVFESPKCSFRNGDEAKSCEAGNVTLQCITKFSSSIPSPAGISIRWINSKGDVIVEGETQANNTDDVTSTLRLDVTNLDDDVYRCDVGNSPASCNVTVPRYCEPIGDSTTSSDAQALSDQSPKRYDLLGLLVLLVPALVIAIILICRHKKRNKNGGNNQGTDPQRPPEGLELTTLSETEPLNENNNNNQGQEEHEQQEQEPLNSSSDSPTL